MAQIGSFALLLALALSVYSFGVGLVALFFQGDPNWERLGETARRAGVVVFGAVVLAAIALVVAAFRDDSRAGALARGPRPLPRPRDGARERRGRRRRLDARVLPARSPGRRGRGRSARRQEGGGALPARGRPRAAVAGAPARAQSPLRAPGRRRAGRPACSPCGSRPSRAEGPPAPRATRPTVSPPFASGSKEGFDEGVALLGSALDAAPDYDRARSILERAVTVDASHPELLGLYERVGRQPGQERALVDALRLRSALPGSGIETVREAVAVASRLGDGELARSLLGRFVDARARGVAQGRTWPTSRGRSASSRRCTRRRATRARRST